MSSLGRRLFIKLVLAILCLAAAAVFSEAYAATAEINPVVDCKKYESDSAKAKKTKRIKTFTRLFWEIVEEMVPTYNQDLAAKGVVVGDLHFANLGLYFDQKTLQTILVVNDLDDSGVNYLVGDILKFLVYLKTIPNVNFKNVKILDAYIDGLGGGLISEFPAPLLAKMEIKNDKDVQHALENYEHYIHKKKKEGEKFADNELKKEKALTMEALEQQEVIPTMIPELKWLFQENSGSSKGMDRYSFIVKNRKYPDGAVGLLEFKMLKCSASNGDEFQNLGKNFSDVSLYMRKALGVRVDSFIKAQSVVSVNGDYYLRRFKSPNLINDLGITSQPENIQQEYAEFFARFLGRLHSAADQPQYRNALIENKSFILDQAKRINDKFFGKKMENQ